MDYATLLVHLRLGATNEGVLKVTSDLAKQYEAAVIGIAAFHPVPLAFGDIRRRGNILAVDGVELGRNMLSAENEFKNPCRARLRRLSGDRQAEGWICRTSSLARRGPQTS